MKVVTIGRIAGNDVVIPDDKVSRYHVQIIMDDYGCYTIQDMGSKNGTYVNGNEIKHPTPLGKTDIVRIGNTVLPWLKYFTQPIRNDSQGSNTTTLQQKKSKTFFEKITSILQ